MRNSCWAFVAAVAMFAAAAHADNRVAPTLKAAPHVHNMTTPGSCPDGYNPGTYNNRIQCIRCDYDGVYYPNPWPPVCASCPDGYEYKPYDAACFPLPPKPKP